MKNFDVRRGAPWMAMALFFAVAGCGGDSGTNGGGGNGDGGSGGGGGTGPTVTTSVTVSNNFFNPASIQVSPGATVTWTWAGGSPEGHNVTFASSEVSAPSATQTTGTFQVDMPTAPGEYAYQCTIHPTQMNATVTVQ
ncbi:MAG: cupredoxin domain-containing protein [Gemmatimonadetes bacterium]|nr:cupredoxin domain-containing protein [Gemmatimonadota bacterium]